MDNTNQRLNRPKARQSLAHIPSTTRTSAFDKQNATIDLSATRSAHSLKSHTSGKRARGKSIGPGGLEALKETDGNVVKNGTLLQPRSILKPTVPLTPPKGIPTFDELRQRSTRKKSPAKGGTEALLIDFSTPGPSRESIPSLNISNASDIPDPFSPLKVSKLNGDTTDQPDVDEEERQRNEQKKIILEQRAARRKSMANRRVSFAPEATLHTWSVMEMVEDSTTSSASNSTRRQSSMTAQQTPYKAIEPQTTESEASEPPSTPPEQTEEPTVQVSPAHQRDLHQKKRRRRSSAMSIDDASGDEIYSSSPSGDVAGSSPIRIEDSIESDSDTDGDTAMSIDELTQNTVRSNVSGSSTHSSLDDRLKLAASQAGTRGIEYDEHGDDISMEIANDTVTNAFQPWARDRYNTNENQENIYPEDSSVRAPQVQEGVDSEEADITEDMTMEMTRAIGGILGASSVQKSRRKSAVTRRSSMSRRQSVPAESSFEDETMDFTTIAGGILSSRAESKDETSTSMDEDVTMEFTTAFGGLRNECVRDSTLSLNEDGNETMEMTTAMGGILAPIEEQTEPQTDIEDEETMDMETTKAVGKILSNPPETIATASNTNENVADNVEDLSTAGTSSLQIDGDVFQSTPKHKMPVASETGSPSLAIKQRSSGRNRSARASQVTTPSSSGKRTPQKVLSASKQVTPPKQLTPVPTKAQSVERTPISAHVTHRGSSPRKLFQAEIQARTSPASGKKSVNKQQDLLFAQDVVTGRHTPRVVLQAPDRPHNLRRRSGGSAGVTQLLARRSSIGDAAPQFKLEPSQTPRLRFEDPKQIVEDLNAQRAEDQRRESGRFMMEQEANEQQDENATLQLRDMIESMTPKKNKVNKFKGRKSLAVGSARGVLGKRPVELDNEEEHVDSTPKRLKGVSREGSPVKSIHLPKPPTKEETTGRLNKFEQMVIDHACNGEHTPTLTHLSSKIDSAGSPQQLTRYRNISQEASAAKPTAFENKLDNVVGAIDPRIEHPLADATNAEDDKISLQQFLNMTNIHFIELNTTKRRHTMAQSMANDMIDTDRETSNSARGCFVAAATTMPLLELYQHATRELKSYISTGRKIIRSIESETLAEQPALFREYVDARPDVKVVMDNQFRNGKINARLQSREGWYSWRSQLVDGLQSGLKSISSDLQKDLSVVQEQVEAIAEIVPELTNRHEGLARETRLLEGRIKDIDNVDHHALKTSREDLQLIDSELDEKLAILESLQQEMLEKDDVLAQAAELQTEMQDQIEEANRVREEHHEWGHGDVLALKTKVDTITKQTGWSIVAAEDDSDQVHDYGVALTMSYKHTLRLFFHPSTYEAANSTPNRSTRAHRSLSGDTAPISLTYSPFKEDDAPASALPTEQRFFLQLMQSHLHAISMVPKGAVSVKTILNSVSSGWEMALKVSEEIRLLEMVGVVRVSIQSDERLAVKLALMTTTQGRVNIDFTLQVTVPNDTLVSSQTTVDVSGIYGAVANILDVSKTRKVQAALTKEIENRDVGGGAWIGAVQAFEDWLFNQKQTQKPAVSRSRKTEVTSSEGSSAAGSTTPKSPAPAPIKTPAARRSPLAMKKTGLMQKKTIPVSTSRQDKFKTSQREQPPSAEACPVLIQETAKGKENMDPFAIIPGTKAPAITPEMQEAMMQRTPIKRVGALRRSPI